MAKSCVLIDVCQSECYEGVDAEDTTVMRTVSKLTQHS